MQNELTLEAERSVLGACLISRTACDEALGALTVADWLTKQHTAIWTAVAQLCDAGDPVDPVTVRRTMGSGAPAAYLVELSTSVPTTAHIKAYTKRVKELATLRRIVSAAEHIAREGSGDLADVASFVDKSEALLWAATQQNTGTRQSNIKEVLRSAMVSLEEAHKNQGMTGTPTGFADLDDKLGGLQRGSLVILAARPSMGKTALAMDFARHAALRHSKRVGVWTLETPDVDLGKRLLGAEAGVDLSEVAKNKAAPADWAKLSAAAGKISTSGLVIYDCASSLQQIRADARRAAAKGGLDMVVVDYLQLMSSSSRHENRTQEVSALSRGLKTLARELNVVVVCLSQLNRSLESRSDKRPMMSDLRESGAIEQDADVILFLYREAYYNPECGNDCTELGVAKNRNGPTGRVELIFEPRFVRFRSASWRRDAA